MSGSDLSTNFNDQTDIFGGLFRLFTGSPSSEGGGFNLFSAIGNFLKMIFSWFTGGSSSPSAAPTTASTRETEQPQPVQTSSRSFTQTLRNGWNSATGAVSNFFHGAAFDVSRAVSKIKSSCHSSPTGHCLAYVERALDAGGLRFDGGRTLQQVMPMRGNTHYAKDLSGVLEGDSRFKTVATGFGNDFHSNYTPKVGDIVVWEGGKYGHTQMLTGFDSHGRQKWISDYATNGNNWTGLRNPDSHGTFKIFRQKSVEEMNGLGLRPSQPLTLSA